MKKYKLSRVNEPNAFCSKIETNKGIFYLLTDDNGVSLKELASSHYLILKTLMDYQVLVDLNDGKYKKFK